MIEKELGNFNVWELEDEDGCLTISKEQVQWNHADRTKFRHVSFDVGKGEIKDFEISFDIRITAMYTATNEHRGLLRFWEIRNDWDNRLWIYARQVAVDASKWTIHFEQVDSDSEPWVIHGTNQFDLDVDYHIKISRAKDICGLKVYSDSSQETLLEHLSIANAAKIKYRYIWMASTLCTPKNQDNWSTGYVRNLFVLRK